MPFWNDTIKGDKERNYFKAKDFFENIIPGHFGEFALVKSLIIPEIEINDLVGEHNPDFTNQQVDFYLSQAKLVIEIDGQQHKTDNITRASDATRDSYLNSKGILTVRITTNQLRSGTYGEKIGEILDRLKRLKSCLITLKKLVKSTGRIPLVIKKSLLNYCPRRSFVSKFYCWDY